MTYRTRNIVLASGLAGLALVFMLVYASQDRGGGTTEIAKGVVSVLFAAQNIPQGTPGSTLDKAAFVEKRVPSDAVVPGSISSPRQIAGTVATQETLAGEPVTTRRFGPVAAAGVLAKIRGPQRVVQIAG